jgi:hypothetical protein
MPCCDLIANPVRMSGKHSGLVVAAGVMNTGVRRVSGFKSETGPAPTPIRFGSL